MEKRTRVCYTMSVQASISPPTPPRAAQEIHSKPVRRLPKQKRVILLLETSKRAASRYGADFGTQVLYSLLDGLTVNQIAAKLECGDDVISSLKSLWQEQTKLVEGEGWEPKATNPRRARKPKKATSPNQFAVTTVTSSKDLALTAVNSPRN